MTFCGKHLRGVTAKASILVVDDDPDMRRSLSETLRRDGHIVFVAEDGHAGIKVMEKTSLDLIITDLKMPGLDGMGLLFEAKKRLPDIPVVMITGYGSVENAVEAMKKGAFDYILKPCPLDIIEHVVERALNKRCRSYLTEGRMSSDAGMPFSFVTQNQRMHSLLTTAQNIAASRATVFVQGESGTGKELLARFIHGHSDRKSGPFVGINCAALPEGLLESELFGHEKGAFTGAIMRKIGKFELADKGTILLDEISEMPIQLQAKLLRVLQESEIDRVGGKGPVRIDVRVIATTNRDIQDMVSDGLFREDLFYRLNVIPLKLPALRDRKEDIPVLGDFFMKKYSKMYGRPAQRLSDEAVQYLQTRIWKGNVRELENTMERGVLLCESAEVIINHLLLEDSSGELVPTPANQENKTSTLWAAEKALILKALNRTNGNRTHAAKTLGISVRTLRNKLQEYRVAGWVEGQS